MKSSSWTVLFSLLAGVLGGAVGSHLSWGHSKVLRAEALELVDQKGNKVYLGPSPNGSALRFLDTARQIRAEADGSGFEFKSKNSRYASKLITNDLGPMFTMDDKKPDRNNHFGLGFGLFPDDTLSTRGQNWFFYSCGRGGNSRATFGSRLEFESQQISGSLALCCDKSGNFWQAPPKNDTLDWRRFK